MLTENDIIDLLENYFLQQKGKINNKANTKQRGYDLKVQLKGRTFYIEAKGETSSKIGTKNYGNPFTTNQISNHIARAILAILKIQEKDNKDNSKYVIAFPETYQHRKQLAKIQTRLKEINIDIYLVSQNKIEIL